MDFRFIAIEGSDGAGKDTQARLLAKSIRTCRRCCITPAETPGALNFSDKHASVWLTNEPTGITPYGRYVQSYLRATKRSELPWITVTKLYVHRLAAP